jgi:BirA family biotin operon repressor/biotin-[acetyl-CoA-carboxylase] ligase
VLLNGRKVAGILSESEFTGGEWAFSVLGFGINVNLQREQFGHLRDTATSLSAELGHEVDRVEVLARVLGELESLYLLLQGGQFGTVHAEWVAALDTLGRRVSIVEPGSNGPGSPVEGKAVRVDADGALVVLTDSGVERRVLAGDVLPS